MLIGLGAFMNHSLDTRRKLLRYLTCHTGTRETDILLGGFVKISGNNLNREQIEVLEELLGLTNDLDLLEWITERSPVPKRFRSGTLDQIITYVRERSNS